MASVYDLIKGRETYHADVNQTVMEVARLLVEKNIGAVAVLDQGQLAGIFSERDLMRRVVVAGLDARNVKISEVMSKDPLTVSPDVGLDECMVLMKKHGFRHLPIARGKELLGVISLRDLLLQEVTEKHGEVQMMRAYIAGS